MKSPADPGGPLGLREAWIMLGIYRDTQAGQPEALRLPARRGSAA